ncbi:TPA: calmodulin, partial [Legionella pneumophila]|nr:calmodulin [Legionella pneumophila]HAT8269690.1 calmodulin [Legionella pneumophila]
ARAAYGFIEAQINKLFEDNSKNSEPSFESFSADVQQFLNQINYIMKNPSARSNSIASTINLLKQLINKRDFNPEQSLKTFSGYKEIMIQLLLKPFETPVAGIAGAPATAAHLIEKQSGIKTRLREMTSSANKEEQPVISPSLMRGPS